MQQLYRVWCYDNGILTYMSSALPYDAAEHCACVEIEKLEKRYPVCYYDEDKDFWRDAAFTQTFDVQMKEA